MHTLREKTAFWKTLVRLSFSIESTCPFAHEMSWMRSGTLYTFGLACAKIDLRQEQYFKLKKLMNGFSLVFRCFTKAVYLK